MPASVQVGKGLPQHMCWGGWVEAGAETPNSLLLFFERVVGLVKLVGQIEAMVEESGDPEGFDAPEWLSRWLREPLPALGGDRPINLLDTMEGQALVSRALAQMQSGAFA